MDFEFKTKYVVYGIIAFLIMWIIFTNNSLVRYLQAVDSQSSNVEVVIDRQYQLIPNLVEVVKGYASHEKSTLEEITKARASIGQTKIDLSKASPEQIMKFNAAQGEFAQALSKLMVVAENYPNLKANENFKELQAELAGSINRIATERRKLNQTVQAYNVRIKEFPANILAGSLGYTPRTFFQTSNEARQGVKVKF